MGPFGMGQQQMGQFGGQQDWQRQQRFGTGGQRDRQRVRTGQQSSSVGRPSDDAGRCGGGDAPIAAGLRALCLKGQIGRSWGVDRDRRPDPGFIPGHPAADPERERGGRRAADPPSVPAGLAQPDAAGGTTPRRTSAASAACGSASASSARARHIPRRPARAACPSAGAAADAALPSAAREETPAAPLSFAPRGRRWGTRTAGAGLFRHRPRAW